jgi:hypothetical protein
MITLDPHQIKAVADGKRILTNYGLVYVAGEVRTRKTVIAITIIHELKYSSCLFITKKKVITGIEKDYNLCEYKFKLNVINFEQILSINESYDIVVIDEAHALGAYPKPSKRTINIRDKILGKKIIYLSGTPTPESYSQIFHQFWVSIYSPFAEYKNFYHWARQFVDKRQKKIRGLLINDYSRVHKDLLLPILDKYMIKISQQEAGIKQMVNEHIIYINVSSKVHRLVNHLIKHSFIQINDNNTLVCDTPVKLQSRVHQIFSGTVKSDQGVFFTIDKSKALFVKERFKGKKIAIFYKFIAEGNLLRKTFPNHTDDPHEFEKRTDLTFICQIVSGREGISLKTADALIMYNIDFSATSYFQGKARMQDVVRIEPIHLYWIFAKGGIEEKILKMVSKKKNYTVLYFKKDYVRKRDTKQNYQLFKEK